MKTALQVNIDTLKKRGMSEEFIELLGGLLGTIVSLNSKQEKLKGELRAATAEIEVAKTQLHKQMTEAIKVVKLEIPKERWIEFGIVSKQ